MRRLPQTSLPLPADTATHHSWRYFNARFTSGLEKRIPPDLGDPFRQMAEELLKAATPERCVRADWRGDRGAKLTAFTHRLRIHPPTIDSHPFAAVWHAAEAGV